MSTDFDFDRCFCCWQAKKKRGTKLDTKRKAAVNAVQWFDRVVGRHKHWQDPPGGTHRCRSEAWGMVSCERFVKATKDSSPFSAVDMLCWDVVDADMRKLIGHARYTSAGIHWTPSAGERGSTPHTMFGKVGEMELLYLGTLATPPLAVTADLVPTQDHLDYFDALAKAGVIPFEGAGSPAVPGQAAAAPAAAAAAAAPAAASAAAAAAAAPPHAVAAATAAAATGGATDGATTTAAAAAGAGAAVGTCAAGGTCGVAHGAGDGSCERVQLCCPAVELEDEEEEEEDKDL